MDNADEIEKENGDADEDVAETPETSVPPPQKHKRRRGRELGDEWRFVRRHGQGSTWSCKFCGSTRTGSGTRVRLHLRRCRSVPFAQRLELNDMVVAKRRRDGGEADTLERSSTGSTIPTVGPSPQARILRSPLPFCLTFRLFCFAVLPSILSLLQEQTAEDVDDAVAEFFCVAGIPFHVARLPEWKMLASMLQRCSDYDPPSSERLRTTLLERQYISVQHQLQRLEADYERFGVTVACDMWTSTDRHALLNFVLICRGRSVFHKLVDTSGSRKNGRFIAERILEVVDEVGSSNIVCLTMDNAPNNKSAGDIVSAALPSIYVQPCAAHVMDLLVEDICNLPLVSEMVQQGRSVVNWFSGHQITLDALRAGGTLLRSPASTRFATNIIMFRSLLRARDNLVEIIASDQYNSYEPFQGSTLREEVDSLVLDDGWWDGVLVFLELTNPIMHVLRLVDSCAPCTSKVFDRMFSLGQKLEAQIHSIAYARDAHAHFLRRWDMMHNPLHGAGYCLDPGIVPLALMCSHLLFLPPTEFLFCDPMASEAASNDLFNVMESFASGDEETLRKMQVELQSYLGQTGTFSNVFAKETISSVPPAEWWAACGGSAPNLRKLAMRVLSQTCSSSPCERNFSSAGFIHTKRRNRLQPSQLDKLLFVFQNRRLLHEYQQVDQGKALRRYKVAFDDWETWEQYDERVGENGGDVDRDGKEDPL